MLEDIPICPNLVLFDADSVITDDGGYDNKLKYLRKQKTELKVEFESFLFPNNQDSGTLETLLLKLVNPEHQIVLNCFDEYRKCLERLNNDGKIFYQMPDLKEKVFALINAFPASRVENKKRKKHGPYNDQRVWNMNQEAIDPPKAFLSKYLVVH